MQTITLTPRKGEKFQTGVAFLRKHGFKFDGASKCWTRSRGNWDQWLEEVRGAFLTPAQFLSRNGVELVSESQPVPATTYVGQASMDHEDSIF